MWSGCGRIWQLLVATLLLSSVVVSSVVVSSVVLAASVDVTVTATPSGSWPSAVTGLALTHITDYNIQIDWLKGTEGIPPVGTDHSTVYTVILMKLGSDPANRTDGYQVYYGTGSTTNDTNVDLAGLSEIPHYGAWSEVIYYDALGAVLADVWSASGASAEANFMSITWLFMALMFVALGLTVAMFLSKQSMLGFPCTIFWVLWGADAYIMSTTPWGDVYYFLFFGSFGMAIFSAFAAYGLREKQDTIGDEEMEKGDSSIIDEKEKGTDIFEDEVIEPSMRTKKLRERASQRRSGPKRKGEFDW